ncbi:MAG: DinB family protein [Dehalococcoidia bacterium]
MTPTHSGVLQVTRESLTMIRSAINDLPEDALDWKPLPTANSASVLVAHAVTATRFFLRAGSGSVGSLTEYRATERAEAFRTKGLSKAHLLEMLTAFSAEAETIVAAGTEQHLAAAVSMPSNDNLAVPDRNGAGTLFAAIGHLREHVGHLQLMHDLWLAEHPKN